MYKQAVITVIRREYAVLIFTDDKVCIASPLRELIDVNQTLLQSDSIQNVLFLFSIYL